MLEPIGIKAVKINPKIIISLPWSKSVKKTVVLIFLFFQLIYFSSCSFLCVSFAFQIIFRKIAIYFLSLRFSSKYLLSYNNTCWLIIYYGFPSAIRYRKLIIVAKTKIIYFNTVEDAFLQGKVICRDAKPLKNIS
jgi:hypothetical protein